jgi:succinate dehydrogenase/fumarate reductase flavoprotein subunit
MTEAYEIVDHTYDVVIVGAGGAGLRAALGMASSGLATACASMCRISPVTKLADSRNITASTTSCSGSVARLQRELQILSSAGASDGLDLR